MKNLFNSFYLSRYIFSFFILSVITSGFLTIETGKSYAQIGCEVGINKVGIPGDPTVFTFVTTGADVAEFGLENGEAQGLVVPGGVTATVVEELPPGWVLVDVECETENTAVSEIENGVEIFCSPNGGAAQCAFFNTLQSQVPTLSEWGMISAAVGLGLVGVWFAVRRRKMQDA
jgi:hypothetical protein